jgi:hypothetical protein
MNRPYPRNVCFVFNSLIQTFNNNIVSTTLVLLSMTFVVMEKSENILNGLGGWEMEEAELRRNRESFIECISCGEFISVAWFIANKILI